MFRNTTKIFFIIACIWLTGAAFLKKINFSWTIQPLPTQGEEYLYYSGASALVDFIGLLILILGLAVSYQSTTSNKDRFYWFVGFIFTLILARVTIPVITGYICHRPKVILAPDGIHERTEPVVPWHNIKNIRIFKTERLRRRGKLWWIKSCIHYMYYLEISLHDNQQQFISLVDMQDDPDTILKKIIDYKKRKDL